MNLKSVWKHKITGSEGNCHLFNVNIFDYEWHDTGEIATVKDPRYNQTCSFNVYTVEINGVTKMFAAGEFSNCVWGFYLKK